MCKNIAKSITATEAKPNILSQITDIDGRVPHRWPRSRSEHNSGSGRMERTQIWLLSRPSFQDPSYQNGQRECKMSSFQDPISRPLCMYNEESLVVSDHESSEQTQLLEQLTEAPLRGLSHRIWDSFQDPSYKWDTSQRWKEHWGNSFQDHHQQYTRQ